MFGVTHKHRYFRIQVIVSVCISMLAYFAVKVGILEPTNSTSSAQQIGITLFTIGSVIAAIISVYFVYGEVRLKQVIFTAFLFYLILFGWPFFITSNQTVVENYVNQAGYFAILNFIGFLIIGGITAWLGKLIGILTLLALGLSIHSGSPEILVLTPALAALNITNVYAQWIVAIVISVSSFLADRK